MSASARLPARIAQEAGYDVRTVRTHLTERRLEIGRKEVWQAALKQALEHHHAALLAFAEKIKKTVNFESPQRLSPAYTDDLLWNALNQHTSRSHLWRRLGRWDELVSRGQGN